VVDFNKGGLIVDVKGVRGFVPVSQVLDLRNVTRQEGENEEVTQTLAAMNGRRLPLKIIEINRSRNRLILSERAAVQEQRTLRKDELMDQLEPGQVRRGVVSNLTSFGAFVDLGGADGLVHVSEISYNRVNHPSEVLRVGQEIDVMVLSVDRDSKKIALSLKKALPDPWTTVEERYHVGQVVPAVITKLAKFGAFAKVEEGLEGLIHLSELTDLPVQDAAQVVQEGQHVNVKIIHINNQRRRLGLSVRQAEESAIPQSMQSFGDQDEYGSFSGQDFGDYSSTDTAQGEPASALSPRQEDTGPIGEEAEIPAPEPGPEASVTSDNGNNTSNGDAPADGISIEATEATPHNEHEGTEVASTASQRSANE
jgi:small subunit ribosomal protein S1